MNALNFSPEIVGNAKYTSECAFWLSEKISKIIVITTNPYYPEWKCYSNRYKIEKSKNILILRSPVFIPRRINGLTKIIHYFSFIIFSFPLALYSVKFKPDVIFTVCPTFLSAFNSHLTNYLIKKIFKKKTLNIIHFQDLEIEAAFNLNILKGNLFKRIILYFEKLIINKFDLITSISESMIVKLKSKLNKNKKLYIFPNFIDSKEYQNSEQNYFGEDFSSKKTLKIMYSGTINEKFACDTLIQTINTLQENKKILWIISGEGPKKQYLINNLKHNNRVKFTTFQSSDKLASWLNIADIHIVPYKISTSNLVLPSKLLGILSAGKPIVGFAKKNSDLGRILELSGILLTKEDPKLFVKAINKLINNPSLRDILGENGRKYILKNHEKELILSNFLEEIQNYLQN